MRSATIDEQLDTCDKAGIVGRQENSNGSDIAYLRRTSQRRLRNQGLFEVGPDDASRVRAFGLDSEAGKP